jgi:hypothetical protein
MDIFRLAAALVILPPLMGVAYRIDEVPSDLLTVVELGLALGLAFVAKELAELAADTYRRLRSWWLCAFKPKPEADAAAAT